MGFSTKPTLSSVRHCILQLLGGPAAGLDMGAVARQITSKLRPGLEAVQLLEQPAFFVVGVGLEYMAVGANHRKYAALVVVGVLIPRAIVGLGVVLVGPHHLGQVAVAVVEAADHTAVLLDPPDLPVQQIVLHPGPAPLVVRDLHQVPGLVVGKLRAVVDTSGLVDVGFCNQPVHRVVLTSLLFLSEIHGNDKLPVSAVLVLVGVPLPVNGAGYVSNEIKLTYLVV